jgi:electron transfer flavoprotein beta subunit
MKILVLLRQVPDLVEDLEVDGSGKALDDSEIKFKLNEYDEHALEEAILLKERGEADEVVALTQSGEGADKVLYTALAKGATKAQLVECSGDVTDSLQLSKVFAEAAKAEGGDLIMVGVQSVDDREGQLAPIVASTLGMPCVSAVTGVKVSGGVASIYKEYSGGIMGEFEADLPVVVGIQAAEQPPRYAPVSKIKQIQDSAELGSLSASAVAGTAGVEVLALAPPPKGEGAKMLESGSDLAEVLKELGIA